MSGAGTTTEQERDEAAAIAARNGTPVVPPEERNGASVEPRAATSEQDALRKTGILAHKTNYLPNVIIGSLGVDSPLNPAYQASKHPEAQIKDSLRDEVYGLLDVMQGRKALFPDQVRVLLPLTANRGEYVSDMAKAYKTAWEIRASIDPVLKAHTTGDLRKDLLAYAATENSPEFNKMIQGRYDAAVQAENNQRVKKYERVLDRIRAGYGADEAEASPEKQKDLDMLVRAIPDQIVYPKGGLTDKASLDRLFSGDYWDPSRHSRANFERYTPIVNQVYDQLGLDDMMKAFMDIRRTTESDNNPNTPPSSQGAVGMYQVMPATFKLYEDKLPAGYSHDPSDLRSNCYVASLYALDRRQDVLDYCESTGQTVTNGELLSLMALGYDANPDHIPESIDNMAGQVPGKRAFNVPGTIRFFDEAHGYVRKNAGLLSEFAAVTAAGPTTSAVR